MIPKGKVVCPLCKDFCFTVTRDIHSGDMMYSADVRHLDGTEVLTGSQVQCDSCGGIIDVYELWWENTQENKDD